jgi:hypothetical protein
VRNASGPVSLSVIRWSSLSARRHFALLRFNRTAAASVERPTSPRVRADGSGTDDTADVTTNPNPLSENGAPEYIVEVNIGCGGWIVEIPSRVVGESELTNSKGSEFPGVSSSAAVMATN